MASKDISKGTAKVSKEKKCRKSREKHHKICVCQKNAVPLHPLLRKKAKTITLVLSSSGLGQRPLTP